MPQGVFQARYYCQLPNGCWITNIRYYLCDSSPNLLSLATVTTHIANQARGWLPAIATEDIADWRVNVRRHDAGPPSAMLTAAVPPLGPVGPEATLPFNVCALIRLRTDSLQPRRHGRIYIGPIPAYAHGGQDRMTPAFRHELFVVSAFLREVLTVIDPPNFGTLTPRVWLPSESRYAPITSVDVPWHLTTQRRRLGVSKTSREPFNGML